MNLTALADAILRMDRNVDANLPTTLTAAEAEAILTVLGNVATATTEGNTP